MNAKTEEMNSVIADARKGAVADANKYTDSEIVKLQNSLSSTSSDLGSLKTDLGKTQTEVGSLKTDLGKTQTEVGSLKKDLGNYAKTKEMTLAIDEAKSAAITAAAEQATKQSQDWVESQKFAKQDSVRILPLLWLAIAAICKCNQMAIFKLSAMIAKISQPKWWTIR